MCRARMAAPIAAIDTQSVRSSRLVSGGFRLRRETHQGKPRTRPYICLDEQIFRCMSGGSQSTVLGTDSVDQLVDDLVLEPVATSRPDLVELTHPCCRSTRSAWDTAFSDRPSAAARSPTQIPGARCRHSRISSRFGSDNRSKRRVHLAVSTSASADDARSMTCFAAFSTDDNVIQLPGSTAGSPP